MDADAIVVGAGLAGLAATAELARAGRRVLLLDQEPEANLGGQAFWSFGGLFLVGSPEQRRMGIRDSRKLAWQDWMGSAFFDRGADDPAGEDYWAYRWAQAYVAFAAGEKRSWLHGMGVRWLPLVGWAERGGYLADGHGNSVPRFHVTWGTGPAVVAPFERQVREAADSGRVGLRFRHRVDGLTVTRGTVDGVRGAILEPSQAARGTRSSRVQAGEFELHAPAVIVTSGGIGGNLDLVRATWPDRLGPTPDRMICGVPSTSTAGCWPSPNAPAAGWSTATGCGTTPRASRTGTRSGPGTASGSCPGRPRCGSTRAAAGSRRRTSPGSTPWARWRPSAPPASTTRGSCSPRRSSRRSSRCQARSRTPT